MHTAVVLCIDREEFAGRWASEKPRDARVRTHRPHAAAALYALRSLYIVIY